MYLKNNFFWPAIHRYGWNSEALFYWKHQLKVSKFEWKYRSIEIWMEVSKCRMQRVSIWFLEHHQVLILPMDSLFKQLWAVDINCRKYRNIYQKTQLYFFNICCICDVTFILKHSLHFFLKVQFRYFSMFWRLKKRPRTPKILHLLIAAHL